MIDISAQQYTLQQQMADATHAETQSHDTVTIMNELRDKIANFDDFSDRCATISTGSRHCFDIRFARPPERVRRDDGSISPVRSSSNSPRRFDKLDAVAAPVGGTSIPPQIAVRGQSSTGAEQLRHQFPASTRSSALPTTRPRWDRPSTRPKRRFLLYTPPEADNPDSKGE